MNDASKDLLTIRNHGASSITLGHNATKVSITGNIISNSGHYVVDANRPPARAGIYSLYGPANLEISGNRCFHDQPVKTQTWESSSPVFRFIRTRDSRSVLQNPFA
jgi:hypothetical protein